MKLFQKHTAAPDWEKGPFPDNKDVKNQFSPLLLGVSLLFHLTLFSVFFLIQSLSPSSVELPMVKVNLVSLDTAGIYGEASSVDSPDSVESPELPVDIPSQEQSVLPEPVQPVTPVEPVVPPEPVSAAPELPEPEPVVEIPVKIPLVEKKPILKKEPPSPPEPEPVKSEPLKPVVPEQKVSLKKKTYRPEAVLASAKKQIAKSVKKQDENSLDTALTRLRKKVASQTSARGGLFGTRGGPVTGTGDSTRAIDLYNLELMYRIQQNWAFNRQLAGGNDTMEVRILIKILKSGQIRDIWFETRSGNRLLDESALKAVKKSNPLSPLPRGYDTYDVGLIFTPSGLM